MLGKEALSYMEKNYGCTILSWEPVQAGWSAQAYHLGTDSGDLFLKVYDKNRLTAQSWIERIDYYMPVLLKLNEEEALRGRIVEPVLTLDGRYRWENRDCIYLASAFIEGRTLCEERLTNGQIDELTQILATLHTAEISQYPISDFLREDFQTEWFSSLNKMLEDRVIPEDIQESWRPYKERIREKIRQAETLAWELEEKPPPFALCHTDVHGWNLMQGDRLVLIDWEGLRLAPVEADLFAFTDRFFFGYGWEWFIRRYRQLRPDYAVHAGALEFYRIRRRLEDIYEFAAGLLYDRLEGDERRLSLSHLRRECSLL